REGREGTDLAVVARRQVEAHAAAGEPTRHRGELAVAREVLTAGRAAVVVAEEVRAGLVVVATPQTHRETIPEALLPRELGRHREDVPGVAVHAPRELERAPQRLHPEARAEVADVAHTVLG